MSEKKRSGLRIAARVLVWALVWVLFVGIHAGVVLFDQAFLPGANFWTSAGLLAIFCLFVHGGTGGMLVVIFWRICFLNPLKYRLVLKKTPK